MMERLLDNNTMKNIKKITPKKVKRRKQKTKTVHAATTPEKDSNYVSDDERPLKYLKVAVKNPVETFKEPAVSKPCTRSSHNLMETFKEPAVSKPCTRSSHQIKNKNTPNKNPRNPIINVSSDIETPEKRSTENLTQEPTNMTPPNPTSRNESTDNNAVNDVLVMMPDKNTIPYLSSKIFEESVNNVSIRIKSPTITDDAQSTLYGDRGIEQWMEGCPASTDWEENLDINSVIDLPRVTPETPNNDLTIQHNEPYNCQGKHCQQCSHCQVANKGKTLRERLASSVHDSQGASADVYNFDAELDEAPPQGSYQPRKHRPPPPPSVASTSYGDDNKLYFDILPPNVPQIIELSVIKVPNSNERKIKARMIPRSECPAPPKKMSVVEHEIVLDELLKMIPAVNQPRTSEDNFKIPNPPETRTLAKNKCIIKSTRKTDTLESDEPEPSMAPSQPQSAAALEPPETAATENLHETVRTEIPPPTPPTRIFQSTEAPTYYPSEKEFNDPIAYFEKIAPAASKFGICKVIAPENFNPVCILDESINFDVTNQYIARLYIRWGSCAREMAAIKACLLPQGVKFKRPPLMAGVELDLSKLYQEVQKRGGLNEVNKKKEWNSVAEAVGCLNLPNPDRKLDSIYVKYLVPYETLSNQEREQIKSSVETAWINRNKKLLDLAFNPLQRQKKLLGEAESSESEPEEDYVLVEALYEAEDCVTRGRKMTLAAFKNVAQSAEKAFVKGRMDVQDLEAEYWRLVILGERHVCVNAASIDTGDDGYGFSKGKTPCATHPWNLKKLSMNPGNVLHYLGAVLGVTVPTLHLGMVFSTSCWHRDPHGLPWVEYMHCGAPKIWYGIPNEQSRSFRKAVEALCPTSCQNKSIWLPSDITMIPPNLLREHNVSLSRVVQNPGEYIVVFPKAYSCSISTGFAISESVYFATNSWLNTVHKVFQELRESCEPTTFSLEQLLMAIAADPRAPLSVLPLTHAELATLVTDELRNRNQLRTMGIKPVPQIPGNQSEVWNVRDEDECEYCRATLYLSKVTGIADRCSAVCLTHALQMLQKKCGENDVTQLELVLFFSDDELEKILTTLRNRLA